MDAAVTKTFQVDVPNILKSHGRNRQSMAPGLMKKIIQGLRAVFWSRRAESSAAMGRSMLFPDSRRRPLPGHAGNGPDRSHVGGFRFSTAARSLRLIQQPHQGRAFHQIVGVKGAARVFTARWLEVGRREQALGLRLQWPASVPARSGVSVARRFRGAGRNN